MVSWGFGKRWRLGAYLLVIGGVVSLSGCMSRGARPPARFEVASQKKVSMGEAPVAPGARAMPVSRTPQAVGAPSTVSKMGAPGAAPLVAEAGTRPTTPAPSKPRPRMRRIVVYTGVVRVQVAKPIQAADKLRALAESMGGYVQSAVSSRVMVRVPAGKFFGFIEALGKKVGEVFDKQIRSEDITEQYLDLQIRLKAQLAVFKRLQELLKKAQNVKEAMLVEKELARLVEQIERIKGRIRYLSQAASLATITVILVRPTVRHRVISPPPLRSPFRWIRRLGISTLLGYLRR